MIILEGRREISKFSTGMNMYHLFTKTYWSVVKDFEDILKLYWRVLNGDLAENFNIYYFSKYSTVSHQRTVIKVQQTVEVLVSPITHNSWQKFDSISWPGPFKPWTKSVYAKKALWMYTSTCESQPMSTSMDEGTLRTPIP